MEITFTEQPSIEVLRLESPQQIAELEFNSSCGLERMKHGWMVKRPDGQSSIFFPELACSVVDTGSVFRVLCPLWYAYQNSLEQFIVSDWKHCLVRQTGVGLIYGQTG